MLILKCPPSLVSSSVRFAEAVWAFFGLERERVCLPRDRLRLWLGTEQPGGEAADPEPDPAEDVAAEDASSTGAGAGDSEEPASEDQAESDSDASR